jgi:hypothetical protein
VTRPPSTKEDAASARGWPFLVALVCTAVLLLYRGFAGDDTFIHLQYARNLANGHGFSFNPGQPSYGTTGPLWTLLIAGVGILIGGDFLLAAKALGFASAAACVFVFHGLARTLIRRPEVALLATCAFAVDPWFLKWSASGMETPLAVLIAVAALRLHLRRRESGGLPVSALLLGVGTLVRPEFAALFSIMLFDRVFIARRSLGESLWALFLYVVPVLPWALFAVGTFGDVIAATVHAKSGFTSRPEIIVRTAQIVGGVYAPVLVAGLAGGLSAWRAAGRKDRRRWLARHLVAWIWPLALPAAYVVTKSYVASRYLLLISPYLIVLGFAGIGAFAASPRAARRIGVLVLATLVAISVAVQATLVYPRTRSTRGVDDDLIALAEWIRENTPREAVVAVHEVGAVGFFSERRVLDTAGLVSSEALPYVLSYRVGDLLRDMRPDYYVSSGIPDTDRQVFEPHADRMTLLYEREVQREGSTPRFGQPMKMAVYRFDWGARP